jgi:hypothetical protein
VQGGRAVGPGRVQPLGRSGQEGHPVRVCLVASIVQEGAITRHPGAGL